MQHAISRAMHTIHEAPSCALHITYRKGSDTYVEKHQAACYTCNTPGSKQFSCYAAPCCVLHMYHTRKEAIHKLRGFKLHVTCVTHPERSDAHSPLHHAERYTCNTPERKRYACYATPSCTLHARYMCNTLGKKRCTCHMAPS